MNNSNSDSTPKKRTASEIVSQIFVIFWLLPLVLFIILGIAMMIIYDYETLKNWDINFMGSFQTPFLIIYISAGFILAAITFEHLGKEEGEKKKKESKADSATATML